MKLKNILLVVDNLDTSLKFYQDIFGMKLLTDLDGNMILTEGLVLQDKKVWERLIGEQASQGTAYAELYFEENDLDAFCSKLESYPTEIRYLNPLMKHEWGQRVVRFYDPDGHLIEVGEPFMP